MVRIRRAASVCLLALLGTVPPSFSQGAGGVGEEVPVFHQVAGEIRHIRVSAGDTLVSISARVGVPWQTLATGNGLENPNRIYQGQELQADTRRIVPAVLDEGVVANIPEACLYRFSGGTLAARYPVGLGRPHAPTPLGSFAVLDRERQEERTAPATLLEELENESFVVKHKLTPDRSHSLGPYWIQLSSWGYGIHATHFPATVGQYLGFGTIRMSAASVAELFDSVTNGTRVDLVYYPVKIALTPVGEIWLEAHPDVYGLWFPTLEEVLAAVESHAETARIDEDMVQEILQRRDGLARKIGSLAAVSNVGVSADGAGAGDEAAAQWSCLDCPPGNGRRVTFQIQANTSIYLPNPYPIRIYNDARQVVFQPQMVTQNIVQLGSGQNRNFVWEVRDTGGQPLPAGSYVAEIEFFSVPGDERRTLTLPLWVGNGP